MDYANGSLGYGGAYAVKTAYPTPTETNGSVIREATDAVRKAQARVDEVTMRLRNINDEAFGAVPTGVSTSGQPSAPAVSKADELRRSTMALHDTIALLESEVSRLAQL